MSVEDHVKKIRKHMRAAIENVEVELYPFPHFQVENIWPKSVYEGFHECNPLTNMPGLQRPWLQKHSKNNPHYQIRKQVDCYDIIKADKKQPDVQFWNIIHDVLIKDNWYVNLIGNHFKTYFATQYGPLMKDNKWSNSVVQQWFVQRHDKDYFIGPHTDREDRVFTNIFSFPKQEGFEHLGTSLWQAKDKDISYGGRHFGFEGFTKAAQMDYKPNQLFVFFKSRWCFHAVEKFNEVDDTYRYGMQIQVYEPKDAFRNITKDTPGYTTLLGDGR